jgi:hypothetical protein
VYSSFLVSATQEDGVDVDGLVRLPMLKLDVKGMHMCKRTYHALSM